MHFKNVLIIFAGLFVFQTAPSVEHIGPPPIPICFSSKSGYVANKELLPKIFHGIDTNTQGKIYRLSGLKRIAANAAVKLRIADNDRFIFDAAVAAPGNLLYIEETYISNFCIEGKNIVIKLENGVEYIAKVNTSDSFDLEGGTFKVTTAREFAEEIETVKEKIKKNKVAEPIVAPLDFPKINDGKK